MQKKNQGHIVLHNLYIYKLCLCSLSNCMKWWKWERTILAMKPSSLHNVYLRFKPLLLMVLAQLSYTFLYFITEASFNHGMNPHVYVTYRHIVAGIAMFPFAYFLERYTSISMSIVDLQIFVCLICWSSFFSPHLCRKIRPKLTLALFLEIFVLSLVG